MLHSLLDRFDIQESLTVGVISLSMVSKEIQLLDLPDFIGLPSNLVVLLSFLETDKSTNAER